LWFAGVQRRELCTQLAEPFLLKGLNNQFPDLVQDVFTAVWRGAGGFDPKRAPASLAIIPWTILREGVWYPASGGVAAIPRALAAGRRELGRRVELVGHVAQYHIPAGLRGDLGDSGPHESGTDDGELPGHK
jgi:phytoene dehydrogenase-like protein